MYLPILYMPIQLQTLQFMHFSGACLVRRWTLLLDDNRKNKAAPFLVFFGCWKLRKRHQKQGSCDVIRVLLIL